MDTFLCLCSFIEIIDNIDAYSMISDKNKSVEITRISVKVRDFVECHETGVEALYFECDGPCKTIHYAIHI